MNVRSIGTLGLALAWAGLAGPALVEAQIRNMRSAEETTVAVEIAKGFFAGDGLSWYTSVLRGRLIHPTGERTALLADWGVSIAGTSSGTDGTFINPELGLALVDEDGEMAGYFSVVLPLAQGFGDDDASVGTAFFTDFQWPDRYIDQLWSVNVGLTPSAELGGENDARANFEIVAAALIPRNDGDTELVARYGFGVAGNVESARLRADIIGLAILSESGLSFGERTLHELALGVERVGGGVGGFLKVPIDDDLDVIDAIVGLTFTF